MRFARLGCQACKRRHVKCDETRPTCDRCLKAGLACHVIEPVFHIENEYASRHTKRPRGPRPSSVGLLASQDLYATPLRPLICLKGQAQAYYMHYHTRRVDITCLLKSQADDFLHMWTFNDGNAILNHAFSSMALALFSQTKRHPIAAVEASAHYERLLRLVRSEMLVPRPANLEVCLMAIFMMSRYEDAVYCPEEFKPRSNLGRSLHSTAHHDGAMALLKRWESRRKPKQRITDVVKHTRRGMIRSALMRSRALPTWLVDGYAFGERGLELEHDLIIVKVIDIRSRLSARVKDGPGTASMIQESFAELEHWDQEARAVERALEVWRGHFPDHWQYRRHDLPSSLQSHFSAAALHSYASITCASIWLHYYAIKMLINSTRLRIMQLIIDDTNNDSIREQHSSCLAAIQILAHDVVASIPFCFGSFQIATNGVGPPATSFDLNQELEPHVAVLLAWPITIISGIPDVGSKYRALFRMRIAQIGRVVGYGLLAYAETGQWLIL